jgi:nucleoid DNA-binding protein
VLLTKEDEFRERLFPNWDMELVAAADISVVLEDAMHTVSDPKHKKTLFNMVQELNKSELSGFGNFEVHTKTARPGRTLKLGSLWSLLPGRW